MLLRISLSLAFLPGGAALYAQLYIPKPEIMQGGNYGKHAVMREIMQHYGLMSTTDGKDVSRQNWEDHLLTRVAGFPGNYPNNDTTLINFARLNNIKSITLGPRATGKDTEVYNFVSRTVKKTRVTTANRYNKKSRQWYTLTDTVTSIHPFDSLIKAGRNNVSVWLMLMSPHRSYTKEEQERIYRACAYAEFDAEGRIVRIKDKIALPPPRKKRGGKQKPDLTSYRFYSGSHKDGHTVVAYNDSSWLGNFRRETHYFYNNARQPVKIIYYDMQGKGTDGKGNTLELPPGIVEDSIVMTYRNGRLYELKKFSPLHKGPMIVAYSVKIDSSGNSTTVTEYLREDDDHPKAPPLLTPEQMRSYFELNDYSSETRYVYDNTGRLIEIVKWGNTRKIEYNPSGKIAAIKDQQDSVLAVRKFIYNDTLLVRIAHMLDKKIEPGQVVLNKQEDKDDLEYALKNPGEFTEWELKYDEKGRLINAIRYRMKESRVMHGGNTVGMAPAFSLLGFTYSYDDHGLPKLDDVQVRYK